MTVGAGGSSVATGTVSVLDLKTPHTYQRNQNFPG